MATGQDIVQDERDLGEYDMLTEREETLSSIAALSAHLARAAKLDLEAFKADDHNRRMIATRTASLIRQHDLGVSDDIALLTIASLALDAQQGIDFYDLAPTRRTLREVLGLFRQGAF